MLPSRHLDDCDWVLEHASGTAQRILQAVCRNVRGRAEDVEHKHSWLEEASRMLRGILEEL